MNRDMIAVVTGGAGFIGSHMVDLLLSLGYRVHVLDNFCSGRVDNLSAHAGNPKCIVEELDIRQLASDDLLFRDARFVFHFAGMGDIVPSIAQPEEYMAVNVQGTVRVLEAARHARVEKFVYAASSSCYGLADTPTPEHAPIAPQYPYALSKYLGELTSLHWHKVYKLPVNSIRIFNAYGTRSRTSGAYGAVMGVFLRQKLAGKPFTVVGDGSQKRDFVYVSDVADAFLRAACCDKQGESYNLGAGNPQSIQTLVNLLGGSVTYIPKRPGEPEVTWADIRKIQQELGWKPQVTFQSGVSKMLEVIEYWQEAPLWDPDSIERSTASWFECLGVQC